MSRDLRAICERYLGDVVASDPIFGTELGDQGSARSLTDFSPEGYQYRYDLARNLRDALVATEVTEPSDIRAKTSALGVLEIQMSFFEQGAYTSNLNVIASPTQDIRGVFDLMERNSTEDWEAVADRLGEVPQALSGYTETLRLGMKTQDTAQKRQIQGVANQAVTYGGARSKGFFQSLVETCELDDPKLTDRLNRQAQVAQEAYIGFADFLRSTYLPFGRESDGVGAQRWELWCTLANGERFDPLEAYAWGWEELERIEGEMAEIVARLRLSDTTVGTFDALNNGASPTIVGEEAFLSWNQELLDSTISALNGVHFDIPDPIVRIEAMIAPPGGAAAMYYTGPSQDLSRPGRTWYPTLGQTEFPLWREVSTAYHEGTPGHHLQIAYATWLGDKLNPFQRVLGKFSGYVEGWALYAERLMDELGFFSDPVYRLGMLASQAFRAGRVVIDIGLHLGLPVPKHRSDGASESWNHAFAVKFLQDIAGIPREFATSEIDRYLGWPAQATSYKLGERVWLETRAQAQLHAGANFSLKDFHRDALNLGMVSLSQLRQELTQPKGDR